ncbi:hypothetical protein P170DRAFT_438483 [Aspergillus steynii IBT 23096]|uniref:Uncharacterized protein n=1 Tax=Aspergillus steynii IBT 23096 TaxID=1392250 RepID=A0A2I2G1N1_9EURO|nr:uncharacterized protein P170DRAFT_438483 [Aspergillus steynii IBT 23096]PLB46781.1 hypothetical protein P170DRAFT_438483 [Aspergillus steynii IBT 23096]
MHPSLASVSLCATGLPSRGNLSNELKRIHSNDLESIKKKPKKQGREKKKICKPKKGRNLLYSSPCTSKTVWHFYSTFRSVLRTSGTNFSWIFSSKCLVDR